MQNHRPVLSLYPGFVNNEVWSQHIVPNLLTIDQNLFHSRMCHDAMMLAKPLGNELVTAQYKKSRDNNFNRAKAQYEYLVTVLDFEILETELFQKYIKYMTAMLLPYREE